MVCKHGGDTSFSGRSWILILTGGIVGFCAIYWVLITGNTDPRESWLVSYLVYRCHGHLRAVGLRSSGCALVARSACVGQNEAIPLLSQDTRTVLLEKKRYNTIVRDSFTLRYLSVSAYIGPGTRPGIPFGASCSGIIHTAAVLQV